MFDLYMFLSHLAKAQMCEQIIAFGLHTMMGMDMANLPSIYKAASHSNVASVSVCPAKDDCTQQTPSDKAVLFLLFTPPMPHLAMTPDS